MGSYLWIFLLLQAGLSRAILYPRDSETRDQKSLDGIWTFVQGSSFSPQRGYWDYWQLRDLEELEGAISMPVPSSYNDITQNSDLRDFVGIVWYQKKFFAPASWNNSDNRVWLRFGSVHYAAHVFVNGEDATSHEIGHLPFEVDITSFLQFGALNNIKVVCDNRLTNISIPQGSIKTLSTENGKKLVQSYRFDFFNYAGIHRPVVLHTTPRIYISDVTVKTVALSADSATIEFSVDVAGLDDDDSQLTCNVVVLDQDDKNAGYLNYDGPQNTTKCSGQLIVPKPKLWWPYLMDPNPGYMYTLEIRLLNNEINEVDPALIDVYRQPIGLRMITWTNTSILLNDQPLYLRGFGRHEDSDIRGKGLDLALVTKDYNMIKWLGANVFRTSHYPYAEEIMDFADQQGIMIVDECPSVDTTGFSPELLRNHKQSLTELYERDKNRPSVIAWSIANEPDCDTQAADSYFQSVASHIRYLDDTRPVTMATAKSPNSDYAAKYMDIISFNRYNGWYTNTGQLDTIVPAVVNEAKSWHNKFNKPVLVSEYGGDTMIGLHQSPSVAWTEEYQLDMLAKHFEAFDNLRALNFFVGEFVWNFADFATPQAYTRAAGNKKGILTRNRQPKAAAFQLRKRYFILANLLNNQTLPNDLLPYLARPVTTEL